MTAYCQELTRWHLYELSLKSMVSAYSNSEGMRSEVFSDGRTDSNSLLTKGNVTIMTVAVSVEAGAVTRVGGEVPRTVSRLAAILVSIRFCKVRSNSN